MPKGHRHPTRDERCQISALKESGLSDGAIAARLGHSLRSGSALAAGKAGVALRSGSGDQISFGLWR